LFCFEEIRGKEKFPDLAEGVKIIMSMNEKDLVAARLNLDTTKILPAFKVIDEGARKNAESFKLLNAELTVTAKNYADMAKAADKVALSADERRKKIMDESNALVAQRTAQAQLLQAKTKALDTTNQVVEQKLQAQQAIVKKREDAIEQQEKEHQKRMETLSNRATISGVQAGRATGAGSDDATRERVLKEEQEIRRKIAAMEEEAHQRRLRDTQTESNARERALQEEQRIRREVDRQAELAQERIRQANQQAFNAAGTSESNGFLDKIKNAAIHATMFHAVYSSINMIQHALKEGLVDIESNMAGYIQTNEHYFVEFNKGTGEMVMNTQRLHQETTQFIQTAHDLGANIMDVTESARLWGRMYKDVGVVQEMVRQSTKLSTVDLVDLQDATKMMEATLAQYSVQIKTTNDAQVQGNRILDSWSSVAHNTMAPVKDLGAAFERTGKIAAETGVSFDFMNGLMSSGIRNTALGGANLGNMWKTVLGTIRTDKAVNEIENLGVKTKEVVKGVEQWRKAEDILLDLSVKVLDKNYDLSQSYADISRGVFQFAKLAASLNVGDILLGQSASINSTGSTMEYLKIQMDTIQRKAVQVKASLLEIFNTAGDDGLRSSIKGALDVLDQLLIGISKVPKGVFEAGAGIAGLVVIYKTVVVPLIAWKEAQLALTAAIEINTVVTTVASREMIVLSAAAANAARMTAIATAGITLIAGALSIYLMSLGSAEKAERKHREEQELKLSVQEQSISQSQRQGEFLDKLTKTHDTLTAALKNENLTSVQKQNITDQLTKVEQALSDTIGVQGLERLKTAGFTKDAITTEMGIQSQKTTQLINDTTKLINLDKLETQSKLDEAKKRIEAIKAEMDAKRPQAEQFKKQEFTVPEKLADAYGVGGAFRWTKDLFPHNPIQQYDDLSTELDKQNAVVDESLKKIDELNAKGSALTLDSIKDPFSGVAGKAEDPNAGSTISNKTNAAKATKAFSFPLNDIDNQIKQAQMLTESATSLINFYQAKQGALSQVVDDTSQRIELYTNRQNKLHESNLILEGSAGGLHQKQTQLQALYKSGNITLDEYNQQSEAVTSRLASLTKEIDANSIAWWNDAKAIKDAKDQQLKDTFDFSSKWISHQKAMGELSAQQEYDAWVRVQARYLQGTELRKQADEQVYTAKKALMSDEEKNLDDLMKKEKSYLDDSKKAALDKIDLEKQKFVDAQDEKIKALDRLMQAQDQANSDQDYATKLKEKQGRLGVLQSAVGPDGIKERKQVIKDIADMEQVHQKDLTKRAQEAEKQRLQDEKALKEKDFEEQKKDVETHYGNLLKAFDNFKNDAEGRAEALKNIQILKESEKNTEILKNLDTFISQYQSKMSSITNLSQSQEQIDLQRYNTNIDAWYTGDAATKQRVHEENDTFRNKYGIPEDSGKLQHFKDGGVVQGRLGAPQPVIAHAGEMYINPMQQSNLFKLLNFAMPQINFSMPSFDFPKASNVTYVTQHFDLSADSVNLQDKSDVRTFFTERDTLVRRLQKTSGVKMP
jgi:hypothetical protein